MDFIWTLVVCAGLTPEGGCTRTEISAMPSFDHCVIAAQSTRMTRAANMQTFATCELRRAEAIGDHPRSWRVGDVDPMPL